MPAGYDLADFGQANYLTSQVTSQSGTQGNFVSNGYWTPYAVTMTNGNTVMASPGVHRGRCGVPGFLKRRPVGLFMALKHK